MPALLLSPTFWKFAGIALLVVAITISGGMFISHYKSIEAQAALVGPLQAANKSLGDQLKTDDGRAATDAQKIAAAYAARDQAIAAQTTFHNLADQIGTTLQGISKNANATKNPVCLPTDGERSLFNAAVARFFSPDAGAGSAGQAGSVPAGTH